MLFCLSLVTLAAENKPQQARAYFIHGRIELSARVYPTLTPALEEAIKSGLSLPFTYEFQLTQPRLYAWTWRLTDWFKPTATLTYKLSYQALTSQYRISTGGFHRNFSTLPDALSALGILHGWQVLPHSRLAKVPNDFGGRIRLRLDVSQLPKPYQFTAIGSTQWDFNSDWINLVVIEANQDEP